MPLRACLSLFFRLASRWQVRVVSLLAVGAAVGNGLGLTTLILRINWAEMARERAGSGLPVQPGLLPRYSSELILYRYSHLDPYFYGGFGDFLLEGVVPYGITSTILLLVFDFVGHWAARHGERMLAPMRFHNVPREDIAGIRAIWQNAIQTSMPRTWLIALLGFGIGFSGAWVGAWMSVWEFAWWPNTPRWQNPPPIITHFGIVDGVWVLGGTAFAAVLLAAIPARRSLIRSGELARRFCLACGYPRPAASLTASPPEPNNSSDDLCPECGKPFARASAMGLANQNPPAA